MQAKVFMEQVRRAEEELKLIQAKRRHYHELATMAGIGGGSVGSQHTGATSRVETAAVNIVDLTTALDVKEAEYVQLIQKAEQLIDRIPQFKFRQVLTLHYLAGMTMKSVSDEIGYKDEKSVYRARGYALRELQKLM